MRTTLLNTNGDDSSSGENNSGYGLNSAALHIIAMTLMLGDHIWATLLPSAEWLTCAGRLAFPIFAFMIAEGAAKTRSLPKYILRMAIWAVISEIPFNLAISGGVLYPFHQNVLWTFTISLGAIFLLEKVKGKFKRRVIKILLSIPIVITAFIIGFITMADYFGAGVLTVLAFYFFPRGKWWGKLGQLLVMIWINLDILAGYYYEIELFGRTFAIFQQGFALFALIPIWLYNGERGISSKKFRYFCYAFYPVHLAALFAIRMIVL